LFKIRSPLSRGLRDSSSSSPPSFQENGQPLHSPGSVIFLLSLSALLMASSSSPPLPGPLPLKGRLLLTLLVCRPFLDFTDILLIGSTGAFFLSTLTHLQRFLPPCNPLLLALEVSESIHFVRSGRALVPPLEILVRKVPVHPGPLRKPPALLVDGGEPSPPACPTRRECAACLSLWAQPLSTLFFPHSSFVFSILGHPLGLPFYESRCHSIFC